ncbi:MAG: hypothetical protein WAV07_16800 [Candidatus Contendobacter sp.]
MSDFSAAEPRPEESGDLTNHFTRIPCAAHARLLLHDPEIDAPFMDALQDGLPDEAARLAYLNHLAWQARS